MDHLGLQKFPVLLSDIGGTNARFSFLLSEKDTIKEPFVCHTKDFATFEDALQAFLLHTKVQFASAILAVAGPVQNENIKLTNSHWVMQPKKILNDFGLQTVLIVNDFEAQALSVVSLENNDYLQIGGATEKLQGPCVILGPGTGLGVCGLSRFSGKWFVISGEGGHIDIGPHNEREYKIFQKIAKKSGRVSAEKILSGQGLSNIYHAICCVEGKENTLHIPERITESAFIGDNPMALETLELFITYLGRFAGDLSLLFMSKGGVFLSGGIPQKIIPFFERFSFREAFENKAPHQDFIKTIPVFLIKNPWGPLEGLAAYCKNTENFYIETRGRFWVYNGT